MYQDVVLRRLLFEVRFSTGGGGGGGLFGRIVRLLLRCVTVGCAEERGDADGTVTLSAASCSVGICGAGGGGGGVGEAVLAEVKTPESTSTESEI